MRVQDTAGDKDTQRHARRAVIASTVGSMIEWYDFYIYGLVAATVLGRLFFPQTDPYSATLLSLSTFFLGFVIRPVGAAVFGHFGDRIGRKAMLVTTLLLMGVSTVLVGLVPTYNQIGIWGAVAITFLRLLQGFGVGGEWGGAVAVATEWKSLDKKRGLAGSWPQFGSPLGLLLALIVLTTVSKYGTTEWFETIGWRIPFLLSIVLIGVGLYIRVGIHETPAFKRMEQNGTIQKAPVSVAIRKYWREILLVCGIRSGQHAAFYLFTTFVLSYGVGTLHISKDLLFNALLLACSVSLISVPLFGYLSDIIGRRSLYIIGAVTLGIFAFPYYMMLNSGNTAIIVLAIVMSIVVHDISYGPQPAFIAEAFPPEVRYSGSSLGYQLSSITAGGPAPLIATYLFHQYGTTLAVSIYLAALATIATICAVYLPDTHRRNYNSSDASDSAGIEGGRSVSLQPAQ
ncbi:MFS transporter [Bradyrhizobium erythrophlei]|uniref:Major Facilitator Superfamily protein n=1 Tax=Bradyrhizobium erythrophlei TaxID=1437360 RepID=A0A1M5K269_9BRAD|nr:MFS transporter [Bradyrhizobium erythrophlei]SHG46887.1 Major Facilitator Superfamily protein [Bradyrhizobium erythrophlei]